MKSNKEKTTTEKFVKKGIYVVTSSEGYVRRSFRFKEEDIVYNHVIYDTKGKGGLYGKITTTNTAITAKYFGGTIRKATKEEIHIHIKNEHDRGFLISREKNLIEITHRGGWGAYFMPGIPCIANRDTILKKIIQLGKKNYRKVKY